MSLKRISKRLSMLAAGCAIALSAVLGLPNGAASQNYQQLYVFGDSLSDTGNAFKTTQGDSPPSPPYFRGRYSNGPVWAEYLASKLKVSVTPDTNFAFGGATSGDSQSTPPGLLTQVQRFKTTHSSANPNALYIVWAGANDYLGGGTDTAIPIDNIATAVKSLAAAGAKNIAVLNLPDLGKLPGTRDTQRSAALTDLTRQHNAGLAESVNQLRPQLTSEIKITYVDVNALFNQAIANPEKYGFENATQACLSQGSRCKNPDKYVFWDDIHPTTAAHKLLVDLSTSTFKPEAESFSLSNPGVTVPLGVFVLGGIGAGVILKRQNNMRKKK